MPDRGRHPHPDLRLISDALVLALGERFGDPVDGYVVGHRQHLSVCLERIATTSRWHRALQVEATTVWPAGPMST